MSDEIRPAIAGEEWLDIREFRAFFGGRYDCPRDSARAVALANDEMPAAHPLKFTRADVGALTDAAATLDGDGWDGTARLVRGIASRIAALLPPDPPPDPAPATIPPQGV